jgi:hypothetical protein
MIAPGAGSVSRLPVLKMLATNGGVLGGLVTTCSGPAPWRRPLQNPAILVLFIGRLVSGIRAEA